MTREPTPLQSWLLGHIDTATLLDQISGMGESGIDLLRQYGRVQSDPAYAAELIEQAQRAAEDAATEMEVER